MANVIRALVVAASFSAGLADAIGGAAALDCWSMLPAPLSPHAYHNVVEVEGRVYVVAGRAGGKFEEYEPRAAVWRELPPMPTQRAFPAAVAIGTSIYVVGGLHPAGDRDPRAALNVVEEFDITSKNWRRRADMPTPRSRLAAVAAGGKILAIAGLGARGDVSVTEIYDPANDRWEPGPALPLARHGHSAVNVDGVVFVLGGYATSDGVMAPQSRVDALNLSSRQWERRADLPTARGFLAAVTWGQWIYAIGGRIASGAVERYRVPANTWEVLADMPAPRQRFGAAVVDGRIIAVGGESQGSREAIRYDPRCERPSPKPGR